MPSQADRPIAVDRAANGPYYLCMEFPLDPTISALVTYSESLGPVLPCAQYDARWLAMAGAFFMTAFAMVATQFNGTPVSAEQARGARHLAYREGVVRPPRRPTAAQRHAAECRAWGFTS